LQAGLSYNQVARALKISKSVVGKYVLLARVAGVDWDTAQTLSNAGSRRQRGPIAIAAALDDHRGVRRAFLPRGLCNTCPDAAMALDRPPARAGVAQP
jgi:hypothetical protein